MTATSTPVIIEAAINGVTTKQTNPHVPRSAEEITADALRCFAAGAAIVHNHVDVYLADGPTAAAAYLEAWQPIWETIPGALLYPTVNGGPVEQSYAHFGPLAGAGCRIGVIDPGSVNLGDFVYANSRPDVHHQAQVCRDNRLAPSLAIWEPGFLRLVLDLWQHDRLPSGAMIKLYFGGDAGYLDGPFGLPPTRPSFDAYLAMLDGCPLPWSAGVIGGDVIDTGIAEWTIQRGGHLHVGLEDWAGDSQPTNAELVDAAVALCAKVGRPVATHTQTIDVLGIRSPLGTDQARLQGT
jgi:3-keto-5-aminohexanoate cleavage enzyme